jgi:hypothetical protein
MSTNTLSIRPFIGSKDFNTSRAFYREIGFEEVQIDNNMSVFKFGALAFYLQNAYVKDWIDNTMVFMEVTDAQKEFERLNALALPSKFAGAKLSPVRHDSWGSECFLHDPSGVLWHIGHFKS